MKREVTINETEAKSILSDSGIYSVDYSLNPYTGCAHGCRYCYATFMKRYTNHTSPWGSFVDVKINAPHVLATDLTNKDKGSVLVSSVTDPYQPVEENYKITRKLLKRLARSKFPTTILTKSSLVTRDKDVLSQFRSGKVDVGLTINFTNDRDCQLWEPGASPLTERFEAIEELAKENIPVYVHVGPYLPGITDLRAILERVGNQITELQIENLNTKGRKKRMKKIVSKEYPNLDPDRVLSSDQGKREILAQVDQLRSNYNVDIRLFLD